MGASVEKNVDPINNVCTITVKGNDYDVNPANKTVYTVKLTSTTSIGSVSADNAANHKTYTLGGVRINKLRRRSVYRGRKEKDGEVESNFELSSALSAI